MLDFLSYNFRYRYRLYNVETDASKTNVGALNSNRMVFTSENSY